MPIQAPGAPAGIPLYSQIRKEEHFSNKMFELQW